MKGLLFIILLIYTPIIYSQEYTGRILNEQHEPIAYANVVLLEVTDSSFVNGCITDSKGYFALANKHTVSEKLLRISHIGHKTKYIQPKTSLLGEIILIGEENSLQEVVIKAQRPIFKMESGILTANVKGTIYSKLGTASEVLNQLPFISSRDNKIEVFGRGVPLIYLDNRQIRNNYELEQLKSESIKEIQIIMNPGSQYSSNVESVIKITTLRPQNEGFGGVFTINGKQKRNFVHNEQLDLTYRKGGLDLFGTIFYIRDKWKQSQTNIGKFVSNDKKYDILKKGYIGFENNDINLTGGINYTHSQKHHMGLRYSYIKNFNTPSFIHYNNCYVQENDELATYSINNDKERKGKTHYVNTYYRKEYSKNSTFNTEVTFINKNNTQFDTAIEKKENKENLIPSESYNVSNLYAFKLWGNVSLLGGIWEIGTEGSKTINDQRYIMKDEELQSSLPNTVTKSTQKALSTYLSYNKKIKDLSVSAGVRYEYVDFSYLSNGKEEKNKYHNIFPSISLSYKKNEISMSLSYRTTFIRPGYSQLRSNISYNDSYYYESGNPALKMNINHRLGLLMNCKNFTIDLSYWYLVNDIMLYQRLYEDKPVVMSSFINHDRQRFYAGVSYSPFIYFWKPTFTIGVSAQKMCYNNEEYNKPTFYYEWRNIFYLSNNWIMRLNVNGKSYGHSGFITNKPSLYSDISVKRSFGKRFDLYIGAIDLFNTYRERWTMKMPNDITFDKWNNPDNRCIYVRAVVKMNKASNKYKGGTAGASEKSRL